MVAWFTSSLPAWRLKYTDNHWAVWAPAKQEHRDEDEAAVALSPNLATSSCFIFVLITWNIEVMISIQHPYILESVPPRSSYHGFPLRASERSLRKDGSTGSSGLRTISWKLLRYTLSKKVSVYSLGNSHGRSLSFRLLGSRHNDDSIPQRTGRHPRYVAPLRSTQLPE